MFRHITVPQLRATSAAVVLLLVINAFQAFDEFYNLLSSSRGYPPYARPPLVYLYYVALGQGQDLGVGSAGAVVLAAAIAVVTIVQARWFGLGRKES
jgi:multiple sugar transport system permease protein